MEKYHFLRYVSMGLLVTAFAFTGCKSDEADDAVPEDEVAACFESGDILVSNSGSDSVVAFDANGAYRGIVYSVNPTAGEAIYGLEYLEATGEVAVVIDGTDRVMAVSGEDCSSRILIADANLTGTVRGVTQLSTGDILVIETNNVERFSSAGARITTGAWPKALQTTGTQINAIPAGGFVHCSTGTDVVRTYDDAGTQVATRASGITGTTDASGCRALASGSIATAWSGTTDTVAIYPADLGTATYTYSNTSVLSTPGGIAERANGNILVTDRALHYIVEITNTGTYVGTIGSGLLNVPEFILVIP